MRLMKKKWKDKRAHRYAHATTHIKGNTHISGELTRFKLLPFLKEVFSMGKELAPNKRGLVCRKANGES